MENTTFKQWNTATGWFLFTIALLVYYLTVEPSLSFWDCGEYISTSAKLQVGHPPGAPLFQIIGAVFAMFATSDKHIAFMVNMVSVLASAFTVLFMYWSVTIILKSLVTRFAKFTAGNAVMTLGASAIGTLAFLFSDSFWFNATEAEVYAMASLFIALLLWAGLRWGEEMHTPRGNKWLLLISLLIGLSFGVHFMALLTIPSLCLIWFFKNYKTVTVKNFILANIAMIGVLFAIFGFLLPYTLALFGKTEIFMVNTFGLPFNSGTVAVFLALAALFYFGLTYTRQKQLPAWNTLLLCVLFMFTGFSTWMLLPIRANANVVLNENNPSNAADVLAYYNREQYPEQKTFYGPMYTEAYAGLDPQNPYTDDKPNYERNYTTGRYEVVNNYKNAKQNVDDAQSGFMPRMSSDKHAANYMAFAGPPKFRLNPEYDYSRDLAQYGIDVNKLDEQQAAAAIAQAQAQLQQAINEFKAAYAKGDVGNEEYDKFLQRYKDYFIIEKPTFAQNMSFMAQYQFGYMYWRYLMWNFAGRQSDEQGKFDDINGNWISGITAIDEARLGPQTSLTRDMLNNKGRNTYFMLPFLLAVIGMVYHARKDPKMFYVLLSLFLFTGIALKIFLNEKPFEVRERDYALVGSYYVFAIWIAFGVYALYDGIKNYIATRVTIPAVLACSLAAVPVLMATQNWDDHDRSDRYTAVAMAKAYLDSCDTNAILFTQGDNDTFPLWYAQEIEGYRTDVRIVCTTLLHTDWYIDSMKRKAYQSDPLPISFSHSQYVSGTRDYLLCDPRTKERININDFMAFTKIDDERATVQMDSGQTVHVYPSSKVRLPVNRDVVIKNKVVAPQNYDSIVAAIDIDLPTGAIYKGNLMMLDIIRNNNWKRPIYFVGRSYEDEDYAWMKDYMQQQGMAYKLVPVKTPLPKDGSILDLGYVDSKKMYDTVKKWDWGNSGSPKIYHDPETRHNGITYRKTMIRLMDTLINENQARKAHEIIDLAMEKMPVDDFGFYFMAEPFADGYYRTGDKAKARQLITKLISKQKDSLRYYRSLPITSQNAAYRTIVGNIEQYRNLLITAQNNGDVAFYEKHKQGFNNTNGMFPQFGRQNEN